MNVSLQNSFKGLFGLSLLSAGGLAYQSMLLEQVWAVAIAAVFSVLSLILGSLGVLVINKRLHKLFEFVKQVKGGDFSARFSSDASDEFSDIGNAFSIALHKLGKGMDRMEATSDQLTEIAADTSSNAAASRRLSADQSDKVDMIATAVEQVSSSIGDVANDVQVTADTAESIGEQAEYGQNLLMELLSDLKALTESVQDASATFEEVEQGAKSIDHVLEVITGVAEQTNLLALNAAIEAARAGEHGRGFAVVADEVRGLAMRTSDSAGEIGSMVNKLYTHISKASEVSDRASEMAVSAADKARHTGERIEGVLDSIQNIADRVSSIASAIEEQRAVSVEISGNVVQLASLAEENNDIAQKVDKATTRVSKLATSLNEDLDEVV